MTIPESLDGVLHDDARETLESVFARMKAENILFGSTLIVDELVRKGCPKLINWLAHQEISALDVLNIINQYPYNQASFPDQATPAGEEILQAMDDEAMIDDATLAVIAISAMAKTNSKLRILLLGEEKNVFDRIRTLNAQYSQSAYMDITWRDHFVDDSEKAIRLGRCYIGEPEWSNTSLVFRATVIWYGIRIPGLSNDSTLGLKFIYDSLRAGESAVSRNDIVKFVRSKMDDDGLEVRPERFNDLIANEILDFEGTNYSLLLKDKLP